VGEFRSRSRLLTASFSPAVSITPRNLIAVLQDFHKSCARGSPFYSSFCKDLLSSIFPLWQGRYWSLRPASLSFPAHLFFCWIRSATPASLFSTSGSGSSLHSPKLSCVCPDGRPIVRSYQSWLAPGYPYPPSDLKATSHRHGFRFGSPRFAIQPTVMFGSFPRCLQPLTLGGP